MNPSRSGMRPRNSRDERDQAQDEEEASRLQRARHTVTLRLRIACRTDERHATEASEAALSAA